MISKQFLNFAELNLCECPVEAVASGFGPQTDSFVLEVLSDAHIGILRWHDDELVASLVSLGLLNVEVR